MPDLKTVFLQPPSFDGFDGGAGSRYQARREVRSFWFPTWLAQPAALVPDSVLIDAPADGQTLEQVLARVKDAELVIMHTSSPSFPSDARVAEQLKAANPRLLIGLVGARVAVDPEGSLKLAPAVDFVCREEFDYTCQEVAQGRPLAEVAGICYRGADGQPVRTAPRAPIEDMDALPWVSKVYERNLKVENYFIGYLKHPYVSFYTGRGCKSRCTFCLWPQTVGGHRYRVRSPQSVIDEVAWIQSNLPQVREIFFDDDTFTDLGPRAEEIARGLGKLGVTWSCNAKANVPYDTLKIMRDNGLRLLLVGYETGSDRILRNIKKGMRTDFARRFARDCHDLGITVHGTFILGLPGETRETIEQTIRFAQEINPHTIQVSLAAPYPGTELYRDAVSQGWLSSPDPSQLVDATGTQLIALSYPHLRSDEIFQSLERFYRRFYFRPSKILELVAEMATSWEMTRRRLREGVEFMRFLHRRTA
jgi:hopanoid biosynthesis associated radical SAM protein HpnJ